MISVRVLLGGLCLVFAAGWTNAAPPVASALGPAPRAASLSVTPTAEQLSAELLGQTGSDILFEQYPALLKSGIVRRVRLVGLPETVATASSARVDATMLPLEMKRQLQEMLQARLQVDEMQGLLDWYRGPLGRKVVAAELAGVSQDDYANLQETLDALQTRYRGSERERLFARFDQATHATRMMLDNGAAIQVAMAVILSGSLPGADLPSFSEVKRAVESRRQAMRGMAGQQIYLNYLYTYQDLSNEEIDDYIEFARTDSGARFFEVLSSGVYEVLNSHAERLDDVPLQAAL